MTYDEVNAKIGADWAELNARHAQEKLNLKAAHAQLWATYKGESAGGGVDRVNAHNAAVAASAAQRKAQKAADKAAAVVAKTLSRIKVKFLLAADTVEAAIGELQAKIDKNRLHKDAESVRGVIAMERAIIELGGTPAPATSQGSPANVPVSVDEATMDAMLDNPPTE